MKILNKHMRVKVQAFHVGAAAESSQSSGTTSSRTSQLPPYLACYNIINIARVRR